MRRTIPILLVVFTLIQGTAQAEVPLLSPEELKSDSTHIVVGKVRAVYSTTEKSKDWADTYSVAEILVSTVEKGGGIDGGDVVYTHYWNTKWIGEGEPEPHSGGHGGVSKGEFVRAHLERKDGTYHVLLPNGFVSVKPDEVIEKPRTSDAAAQELAAVQGMWVRTVETDRGTFKIIKEHKGDKTTLTVMDSDGRIVEEKNSEFRLETPGKVRVFTFFNNVFTAGPNKGRTDDAPQSYVYRVTGDTFVEVRGLMVGDDERLSAFTWERVKE